MGIFCAKSTKASGGPGGFDDTYLFLVWAVGIVRCPNALVYLTVYFLVSVDFPRIYISRDPAIAFCRGLVQFFFGWIVKCSDIYSISRCT